MPTHVAIQPGRIYPQPGFTLCIDKEGKWSATQVFICHRASGVGLVPRPGRGGTRGRATVEIADCVTGRGFHCTEVANQEVA